MPKEEELIKLIKKYKAKRNEIQESLEMPDFLNLNPDNHARRAAIKIYDDMVVDLVNLLSS